MGKVRHFFHVRGGREAREHLVRHRAEHHVDVPLREDPAAGYGGYGHAEVFPFEVVFVEVLIAAVEVFRAAALYQRRVAVFRHRRLELRVVKGLRISVAIDEVRRRRGHQLVGRELGPGGPALVAEPNIAARRQAARLIHAALDGAQRYPDAVAHQPRLRHLDSDVDGQLGGGNSLAVDASGDVEVAPRGKHGLAHGGYLDGYLYRLGARSGAERTEQQKCQKKAALHRSGLPFSQFSILYITPAAAAGL